MHDEAIYWLLLTERDPHIGAVSSPEAGDNTLAALLHAWLSRGNRSLHDLFALHPEPLAASLGMSPDSLGPLLALRARLPRIERSLALLRKAGVDMLPLWDRRCPRALRTALSDQPPVLWFAGDLSVLDGKSVAVAGARESGPQAVAFARDLAVALAAEGRALLTGLTRAVEKAALDGALGAPGGSAVAVLGQGIARSLPDLQRLQDPLREGRLLVLSPLHPEAFWQPRLELARSACLSALAERVVIADPGDDEGIRHLIRLALERGRPVLQYVPAEVEQPDTLPDGVLPLTWPSTEEQSLARNVLAAPRAKSREHLDRDQGAHSGRQRSRGREDSALTPGIVQEASPKNAAAEETPSPSGLSSPIPSSPVLSPRDESVLAVLRRRRGTIGKGALLHAVDMAESDLDRALITLIASGLVEERSGRTGAGYAAVQHRDGTSESGFQLSLFGQPPG